ncbi:MAG TPA: hypothetical protein P5228_06635 [Bacteroidales bacterium]|nr:hypothetical protein [Bacteroidales bacterium]HRZ48202.1 hypothetical protein [Bacteroidales bacterium]
MSNRLLISILLPVTFLFATGNAEAQCFASSGNPVGGSGNLGVMEKKGLRVMTTYRYHLASRYFSGDELYHEDNRTLSSANYNFQGLLLGYGLTKRLSLEAEGGYYYNKTQRYRLSQLSLRGYGLSTALVSIKYALYQNKDQRFEFTGAAGVNIPFSRTLMSVDGVTLPVDLQPSTSSFGITLQTYLIKENSFRALRFFWVNRYERNFENPQGYVFGSIFNSAAFITRHFVFGQGALKDWTLILQARYQSKNQNIRNDNIVDASGGRMFVVSPQINLSINETWNISLMYEKPLYQYYHGVQLGADYAVVVNLSRDLSLQKK